MRIQGAAEQAADDAPVWLVDQLEAVSLRAPAFGRAGVSTPAEVRVVAFQRSLCAIGRAAVCNPVRRPAAAEV
jgi:hypothetical protein